MSSHRTERLLNLLICLVDTTRPLTKSQIREKVPQYDPGSSQTTFDRMFERDKDDLRSLGVPLKTHLSGHDDELGYWVDRSEYRLHSVDFTDAELTVLAVAAQIWQDSVLAPEAQSALTKIRAIDRVPESQANTPTLFSGPDNVTGLRVIFDAITERRAVSFSYPSTSGPSAKRKLHPWVVTCRLGRWYVTGFDVDRQASRTFALHRMVDSPKKSGGSGAYVIPQQPAQLAFSDHREANPEPVAVQLRWIGTDTHRVRTFFDAPVTGAEFTASVTVSPQVIGVLAAHHDQVAVVAPAAVQQAVTDAVAAVGQVHDQPVPDWLTAAVPTEAQTVAAAANPTLPAAAPSKKPPTINRLTRLLALVPFVTAHQGLPLDDVAAHFGVSSKQLIADLELLFVCGTPGHYPDDLIEAYWSDGDVVVRNADHIATPLRLTSGELAVLVAGLHVVSVPLADQSVTVQSALAKLIASGQADQAPLAMMTPARTDSRSDPLIAVLNQARTQNHRVQLEYYSAGRDQLTTRAVDPWRWLPQGGYWYLQGYCHLADAERVFRLDRIRAAQLISLSSPKVPPADSLPLISAIAENDPVAIVRIAPQAQWVLQEPGVSPIGQSDSSGYHIASIKYRSEQWLMNFVVSCCGQVELGAPSSVREKIRHFVTA